MRLKNRLLLAFSSILILMEIIFLITLLNYYDKKMTADVITQRTSFVKYLKESIIDLVIMEDRLKLETEIINIAEEILHVQYIFVIDNHGALLAHTLKGGFPPQLFAANLLPPGTEQATKLLKDEKQVFRDLAIRVVPHMAAEIHVGMNETFVHQTLTETIETNLLFFFIALAAGMVGIYFFSSYFSKPLEKLISGMEKIGTGDLDFRLPEKGSGEIFSLIRGYNRMAEAIKETTAGQQLADGTMKESEEKYRSMMESIADPVYTCSPDFRVEYMNPAMVKRTGYNAAGDFCYRALHGLEEKCSWCMHGKVQKGQFYEADIVSPKDNHSFHLSCSPIYHQDGSVSMTTIFRDTTKLRNMESHLRQAQKMEAIGTLAGGIAHDFNNILLPIIGYTEMTFADLPPENPAAENLAEILKGALRAKELVKQILTFSRQYNEERKPLKAQLIVKEALKLIRSSLPSTIEIHQSIDGNCGSILADPTQVHQIIMNLCTNAYQAMAETGGILEVTLSEVKLTAADLESSDLDPGTYVCLKVSDTGCGIDNSNIERIFEPYFTTKEKDKGTGMGLAVVHGIIKSYKGDIKVYSEPGKGTVFQAYIPRLVIDSESPVNSEQVILPGRGEHILLVDDEKTIVEIETKMLTRIGYQVTARTSPSEAFELFRTHPQDYDLVITDMTMPGMTGDKLVKELLQIRPDIPIILSTGFSEDISREKTATLGIKVLMMKPVTLEDLSRATRQALTVE